MNNSLNIETPSISSIIELQSISNYINKLKEEIEILTNEPNMDTFEKKMRIKNLNEQITVFQNKLLKGIPIEISELKTQIRNSILSFLGQYGFKNEEIIERLQNIDLYVTNERLSSGGLLAAYSNKIAIDYTLCDFDKDGKFLDFKSDKKEFIKYTLTHEFLHMCSIRSNKSFRDDPLSEGYTDLFAHVISKNEKDKSERYDFFIKICTLLANLIGVENTMNDYFNNLETLPNLKNLFNTCGIDDQGFLDFKKRLDQIMKMQINSSDQKEIFDLKVEILNWLKESIFIPFLKTNNQNQENYINLFNTLFEEFNVVFSLEEFEVSRKK